MYALQAEHQRDFQRLVKLLTFTNGFQFLIAEFNHANYRDFLIQQLNQPAALFKLSEQYPDFASVEAALRTLAEQHQLIHIFGGEFWFNDTRWQALNIRREAIAQTIPVRLVLWLDNAAIKQLALAAPDMWAWRSGIFSFEIAEQVQEQPLTSFTPAVDNRTASERNQRIEELRDYLTSHHDAPDELRLPLYEELAKLYVDAGELELALSVRKEQLCPAYEKAGDKRGFAMNMGEIADILRTLGHENEALLIHQDVELPVYEQLGDIRAHAVTMGRIADILSKQGKFDEALHIRQEKELPVYEQLGDMREYAITLGKIADLFRTRGQLDEALHILQRKQLTVFEQLGDIRSRAVTMGKIADILETRGQLDEALRIRQQDEISVFEQLGDIREQLITKTKIAQLLLKINPEQHYLAAQELLLCSLAQASQMQLPEATTICHIMDNWQMPHH